MRSNTAAPRQGRGKLILFEGIDGSGKGTQAELLLRTLRERGPVALFHHPNYDGPIGQLIRAFLRHEHDFPPATQFQLYTADFLASAQRIRDLLEGGSWVVLDRWLPSAIAYQSSFPAAKRLAAALPLPKPSLTILLDLPADLAVQRILAKSPDRFESSERTLAAARDAYRSLARTRFNGRWAVLDATQSREALAAAVRSALRV